jgi:hypothetical protein
MYFSIQTNLHSKGKGAVLAPAFDSIVGNMIL